jgi:hypothetical protein
MAEARGFTGRFDNEKANLYQLIGLVLGITAIALLSVV